MGASHAALLLTVLVIIITHLISFLLITTKRRRPSSHRNRRDDGRRRLPPSPPGGLPLVGHLHLLGSLPHRSLRSMAASHGPVMLLHLGQVPTVVASSAAAAEEALKTRDLAFASRPRLLMAERLYYGARDMVFAPSGERWRQLHRVSVVHLLSNRRVLGFRAAREHEVAALLSRVRAAGGAGAAVNLSELLIAYSNAVTSRATFGGGGGGGGYYYGIDGGEDDGGGGAKLRKVFSEFEELLGTVPMAEVVPWLRIVDVVTGLERKARRISQEIDRLLEKVIADHRRRRRDARRVGDGEDDPKDFVDVLLDLSDAQEDFGGVQLDTVTIKATILDMLAAGTDTTDTLMEFVMAELINHPTQMRKLQDEIRSAVAAGDDDRGITEDDLPKLPYLKAVIKETLRLHPPGPLLLPRETLEDTELQGYHVPAWTRVLINVWAIGRDPAAWEHAEEFVPERFAGGEDGEAVEYHKMGVDFRFLPFGAGRRGCPGVGFAVAAVELALASLLYHFDWEVHAGGGRTSSPVDMTEERGLAVRLKMPLLLVATPWPR